ncbi:MULTISPECIES: 3-oxoacyl-ACP synthase III family protein [unclassified Leeuwenhoekiella]|uniref:3-oxoacyl-ACP synthase III family protein n=1 Tax=unclassified Leeuwenhoekiella TaxID=2615029 RepID=UPI000C3F1D40|nr:MULTISPECIES: ketoacyl-ACP synthase III [unclassified Leeuwenhoekiella]MAW95587.1 3-oxoacyl-ACP synthase [Leeuwenhoekiella sp.]MBA82321.1 3-oxoacyl-ACP synthase [Leeuwenhoekiella sp.]|tara:strand:- start:17542 stop:18624 length:1083 start_codon:yes stop_codon:yes gene_type:complete
MSVNRYSVIAGTGSYLPENRVPNEDFLNFEFYESNGSRIDKDNGYIIDKFKEITTIEERRYVTDDLVTSDIAYFAAKAAIKNAGIDAETLDYIIVAHNFGDVKAGSNRSDLVPALASRVKHKLKIKNPDCVAYDLPFGCPGWLQGVIQADYFLKSGDANRVLVIGAETISRVIDLHDRDSMIYADGAGATILEARESSDPVGILTHKTRSDTYRYAEMLTMGCSYNVTPENENDLYLKMNGRRLYQYALETVPLSIKACLDKAGIAIEKVSKVLIHQANGKMDDAIIARLYKLYDKDEVPEGVMPMIISWIGNSSVATVPTLLDLILKGSVENQEINPGDVIVFASVGAGMNINAVVYQY